MRGKFSFDVGKLKIGSSRETYRDHQTFSPDSRPRPPKSLRPPLPDSIDAELRAACAYVVTHPKPSHEIWGEHPKPALGYVAIKAGGETLQPPTRKPSGRTKIQARHDKPVEWSKHSYKPTEELFRQDERGRCPLPQISAKSRADQLTVPTDPPEPVPSRVKARANSQAQTYQQQQQHIAFSLVPVPKSDNADPARISARSDFVGTTGSTLHTDPTGYTWSESTRMTSAAMTPAQSKRTSSQNPNVTSEGGVAIKVEPVNAAWMRLKLEKHKKAIEEGNEDATRYTNAMPAQATTHVPILVTQVPARKPVPSRPSSRQCRNVSRPSIRPGTGKDVRQDPKDSVSHISRSPADSGRNESNRDPLVTELRGKVPTRSDSGQGRASRAASKAASRAANRARGITNGVLGHYLPPGSVQPQSLTIPTSRIGAQESGICPRSSSRTYHISEQMKGCIRSVSRSGRKPSTDVLRGHAGTASWDSYRNAHANGAPLEHSSMRKWWRPVHENPVNIATPEMSRPGSSGPANGVRGPKESCQSPVQQQEMPLDLNRELPPLPSPDQLKAVGNPKQKEGDAEQPRQISQSSAVTKKAQNRTDRRRDVLDRERGEDVQVTVNPNLVYYSRAVAEDLIDPQRTGNPYRPRGKDSSRPRTACGHCREDGGKCDRINNARKPSTDEYNRLHDARYQKMVGISAQSNAGATREKTKRKWWHSREKQQASWMDQVVQSEPGDAMVLTDELAGASMVRY